LEAGQREEQCQAEWKWVFQVFHDDEVVGQIMVIFKITMI